MESYWVAVDSSINCQRLAKDDELATVKERLYSPRNANTTRRLQGNKYIVIKWISVTLLGLRVQCHGGDVVAVVCILENSGVSEEIGNHTPQIWD
jgi:hypothetical protein